MDQETLDAGMNQLYNHFVGFIASAQLPLCNTLLVLEMLVAETVAQAKAQYLKE